MILEFSSVFFLRSLETLPARRQCSSRSFCVVVEVVLLDIFDGGVTVVADGRDRNPSLQCESYPGVTERVPGQEFS